MKIGIDIGGSHVGIGLINSVGKIVAKDEIDLVFALKRKNYEKILLKAIIDLITKILEKQKIDITKIEMIGIAVPGTVSNTHIIKAENLHIKNFNIVKEINEYFNIPIQLRNDAKCAAVAEKTYGSLRRAEDAIFLTIGTGIGGAVFLNDELLRPKKYEGFEIGHMIIKKDGVKCNCGNRGCFERYASMRALKERLAKIYKRELSIVELKQALLNIAKHPEVEKVVNEYIKDLAIGIANLINIFEPEIISIGGSFVYYKEQLLGRLKQELISSNLMFNDRPIPNIVVARLKNDAGIIGAVL